MPGTSTGPGPYCELHAHSCFSLLDGIPFPEELAEQAAALGLPAIALTDHDALYGAPPFYARAQALGVRPILGAEVTLADETHLTLLAETQAGWRSLCLLVSAARADAPKGRACLPWPALAAHTQGLLCLTGCRRGALARHVLAGRMAQARGALADLLDLFGPGQVYVEVQRNLQRGDRRLSLALAALAAERGVPPVATGNVHYLARADADLQDALVCIRERRPLPKAGRLLRPNREFYLRSAAAVRALYPDLPQAVDNTLEVAERCHAAPPSGLQVLPVFPTPAGEGAQAYLRRLCLAELARLYARSQAQARALLEKELDLIERLGLANYFLIVWDITRFCREQGILCHGRGSAANSLVARLLGISAVDPIRQGLVVERFLSAERPGPPDIDLDIDAARRETVIQYVYERYGRDHAAMACTYITYRAASAVRDAAYALGFKPETVEAAAEAFERRRWAARLDRDGRLDPPEAPLDETAAGAAGTESRLSSLEWSRLARLAERLRGRPRHLGLHSGGMVLSGEPLAGLIPIEPAAMENRTVVQFDKERLEAQGIVKIDLLGLRMLSAVADALELIRRERGRRLDLYRLNFADPAVYAQIRSAQTIGLFQVESGAQVSVIPHLQPRCFADLVVEVSLIRPGPLQGNMVRPYLRRRNGQEPVAYAHPSLEAALSDTLGVIVFQEQVIKVARDFAGLSAGRGELLRRALSHKNAPAELAKFRSEFLDGAMARGAGRETAEQVWGMIAGFAGYSFSKAHAAAFAVIVFWSAWLRVHYPVEYFCGLFRNAPLGTYPAYTLEAEARRVGLQFLPFDLNRSLAKADVQGGAIRFGLEYVRGIGAERAERIVQIRGREPFRSLADFVGRVRPERRAAEALILAGACDALGERRQLLWDLAEAFEIARRAPQAHADLEATYDARRGSAAGPGTAGPRRLGMTRARRSRTGADPKVANHPKTDIPPEPEAWQPALPLESPDERAHLPPMPPAERLLRTFAVTGVTAGPHLVEVRRDAFTAAGCLQRFQLARMRDGARVKVGGLVADGLRRPPTAKGVGFIRLEDPEGIVDVVIPPQVYAECREALRAAFLVVEGRLQKEPKAATLTVVAARVFPLPGG